MKEEEVLEDMWIKDFVKFFADQEKRFIEKVVTANKGIAEEYGIDVEAELATTIEVVNPLMFETLMTGVNQASELTGQASIADFEFLREWLDKVEVEIGKSITNTTITAFNKTIEDGVAKGEGIDELTKRVETIFDFAKDSRSTMIARTETARGITEAHRQTFEYYGFEEVEWLLSPGACADCIAKDAQTWTTATIKGEIPVHPNCKCDFVPL